MALHALAKKPLTFGQAQHRCVDEPRRDRVDRDPLGTELEGQRLGEADDTRLGRHVVGHERLPALGARRGDVDDPPPAFLDHVWHDGLTAVERTGETDGKDLVPLLEGDGEERIEPLQAGVVHQDGRPAEAGAHLLHTGVDLGAVGDVDGYADGGAAGRLDLGRRLFGRAAVPIEDSNGGAVSRKPLADRQADTRAAAGHDRRAS